MRVDAGRTIALLGPNGAGKTTLLRILATSLRPSFGRAEIDSIDIAARPDVVRRRVAYLSHATGLYDDLTAENLASPPPCARHARAGAAVGRVLAEVGLAADADRRVRSFSAGMRRRLALGRLLLIDWSVVLLDEPHAALDADGMALVDRLLQRWHEAGVTVLVASHQAERVTRLADGWARLDSGLLVETGGSGVEADVPDIVGVPASGAAHERAAERRGDRLVDCPQGRSRRAARAAGHRFHALRGPGAASVRICPGPRCAPADRGGARPAVAGDRVRLLLSVTRLHQLEVEDGALDELARYPVERYAIYLGKMLAGLAAVVVLGGVLLPVVAILYGINLGDAWPALVVTVLLGAIGLAAVGTFYAGVTVRMAAREVMLPLLMLPVVAPLLLAAVKATTAALQGNPLGDLAWLQLLAAFDLVMIVAGAVTYGYLLEE